MSVHLLEFPPPPAETDLIIENFLLTSSYSHSDEMNIYQAGDEMLLQAIKRWQLFGWTRLSAQPSEEGISADDFRFFLASLGFGNFIIYEIGVIEDVVMSFEIIAKTSIIAKLDQSLDGGIESLLTSNPEIEYSVN